MSVDIIILAAGQGTRMHSSLPKVLHSIAGRPMIGHVIDAARQLNPNSIQVVVGHGSNKIISDLDADDLNFVFQKEQLGTGHAVAQAAPFLKAEKTLILYGDVPLIKHITLERLLAQVSTTKLGLLTVNLDKPRGYGRIIRDKSNEVIAIVEEKDASLEQKNITEGNTGIIALPSKNLGKWLNLLSNDNAQNEYYLTDIIALAVQDNFAIETEQPEKNMEVQGVNDRIQLAQLERHYQLENARQLMLQGVTLYDPNRLDIRGELIIGRDVSIDINTILEGDVEIEDNVQIGSNCYIKNSILRANCIVKSNSYLENVEMKEGSNCGPFARLRPGSILEKNSHVGNFVELKNTTLGENVKVGHLTYLGDAEIGAHTNIGAGTITCNYDGANKFRTIIGENAFVGSNSALVAPIILGKNSTIGAGSVITKDVPENKLAIGRSKQSLVENWQRPTKKPSNS